MVALTPGAGGWVGAPFKEVTYDSAGNVLTQNATYYDNQYGRPFLNLQYLDGKYYYDHTRYDAYGRVAGKDYFWRPQGLESDFDQLPYAWHSYAVNYSYNARGALLKVEGSDMQVWWSNPKFDLYGRTTEYATGDTLNTEMAWDPAKQTLTRIQVKDAADNTIQHFTYGFDEFGNLTRREDHATGQWEHFEYDGFHRVKKRAYNGAGAIDIAAYHDDGRLIWKHDGGIAPPTHQQHTYGHPAKPHAATQALGRTYSYDGAGRILAISGALEAEITWTPFGQPASITKIGQRRTEFTYGASHQRLIRTDSEWIGGSMQAVRKKLYVSGWLEQEQARVDNQWKTEQTRLYIGGPGGIIGVLNHAAAHTGPGSIQKHWFHYDHLGSIATITTLGGTIVDQYSYGVWGERRKNDDWNEPLTATVSHDITDRGYTGHEMLDDLGLIHMNGRIYDPLIGRFLSPDPNIQSPANLQNYDRYSYVLNNPLSFTDPSGYFFDKLFKKIGNFFKKYWKVIAVVALTIVTAGWAATTLGPILGKAGALIAGGAAGGFVGGFVGTLLHGGSLSQAFSAGLIGGLIGGLSAGIAHGIGELASAQDWNLFTRSMAHGVTQGGVDELRGGSFLAGFVSGFATSGVTKASWAKDWGRAELAVAGALIGGTSAKIGGGSFENGAVTGAFVALFNPQPEKEEAQGGERPVVLAEDQVVLKYIYEPKDHLLLPEGGDLAFSAGDALLNGVEAAWGGEIILRSRVVLEVMMDSDLTYQGARVISSDLTIALMKSDSAPFQGLKVPNVDTGGWVAFEPGRSNFLNNLFPSSTITDSRINTLIRAHGLDESRLRYISLSNRRIFLNYGTAD